MLVGETIAAHQGTLEPRFIAVTASLKALATDTVNALASKASRTRSSTPPGTRPTRRVT